VPPLAVMFKTVSTDCNLDCSYCYYRESLDGTRVRRRIDNGMLEKLIPDVLAYTADVGATSFAWQGGEPTLAGLPFFEKVVALQRTHARPGMAIRNALQTNAILLDDAWGAFLKRNAFLVGVSLDGPREIHDQLRTDRGGRGSFERVMRGIDVLRRWEVDFNILCVLGPHNVDRPKELMRFYRAQRFSHVRFIPAMDFQAMEPDKPPAYLITPEQYGEFLVQAFDDWHGEGAPTISVRIFDNFLQNTVGVPADLCVHGDRCDAGIVVEYDGSAYPCDFYIHPAWELGNVLEMPLADLVAGPARRAFIAQKHPLPDDCARCEWLAVCRSGCPRNRTSTEDGPTPDYFCRSYKRFFAHADERLGHLAHKVRNRWRYLEQLEMAPLRVLRAGRNDPCPRGSGRKHKQCCQSPALASSYVFKQ
jgi:serine-type anaerobic sulfatase-maturating enzyme